VYEGGRGIRLGLALGLAEEVDLVETLTFRVGAIWLSVGLAFVEDAVDAIGGMVVALLRGRQRQGWVFSFNGGTRIGSDISSFGSSFFRSLKLILDLRSWNLDLFLLSGVVDVNDSYEGETSRDGKSFRDGGFSRGVW
jgi:hypothetical protein